MTRLIDADSIPWFVEGVGDIPVITKDEIDDMPTVDRWIPVSERLPAWGEKVLICNQRGEFALGRITQSDEGNVWDVGTWWIELKEYDAWMPLPDSYRGEE